MKALMTFIVATFVISTAPAATSSVPKLNCLGVSDSKRIYEIKDLNGPSSSRLIVLKVSSSDPKATVAIDDSPVTFASTSISALPDQKNAVNWSTSAMLRVLAKS